MKTEDVMRMMNWMAVAALVMIGGCDSSRTISQDAAAWSDAGRDASMADANLSFPGALEGVWLLGWSGGANHFSWIRFSQMATPSMTKKDAWILEGKDISANLPLFGCGGKTSYWMGAAGRTVYLDLPDASCMAGKTAIGLVFSQFISPPRGGPKGAILSATVKDQAILTQLEGHKFPGSWCDAAMTTCKAPF